jgi:hypothetical protein
LTDAQKEHKAAKTRYQDKIGSVSTEILNQFKDAAQEALAAVNRIKAEIALVEAQPSKN